MAETILELDSSRGIGASGDSPEYSLSKEAEDVALAADIRAGGRESRSGKGQTAAARASIDAALTSATGAARRLDVIVGHQLGEDPVAVAEWERDRRIGYRKAKPSISTSPVAPPLTTPAIALVPANASPPATASVQDVAGVPDDEAA